MASKTRIVAKGEKAQTTLSKHLHGQFAEHLGRCIYEGIWVGPESKIPNTRGIRNDVMGALKRLGVPNLRWPGGCFADEYHWMDGIGPREKRPKRVNSLWGGVVENNHFGTHEFLDLCELIGCEPYISGNVGSGTVMEMQHWIEYLTYPGETTLTEMRKANGRDKPWKIRFFGVGNENWGCGGSMTAEYYADEYRRYQEYVRNYGDTKWYKIACGSSGLDYRWTEVLMEKARDRMHGLSLHYYSTDWTKPTKGPATGFDEAAYFETLKLAIRMDEVVKKHSDIMDKYDPAIKVGLIVDEWGTWFDVEPDTNPGFLYQQNTMRDALVASMTLDILHKHAARVHMANIAQVVNVLQAMVLTKDEKMILTPTYHVFEQYKVHQEATYVPVEIETKAYGKGTHYIPQVSATVSRKGKQTNVSLSNFSVGEATDVEVVLEGIKASKVVSGSIVTAKEIGSHNTFEKPEVVKGTAFTGAELDKGLLKVKLPAKAVITVVLQ